MIAGEKRAGAPGIWKRGSEPRWGTSVRGDVVEDLCLIVDEGSEMVDSSDGCGAPEGGEAGDAGVVEDRVRTEKSKGEGGRKADVWDKPYSSGSSVSKSDFGERLESSANTRGLKEAPGAST